MDRSNSNIDNDDADAVRTSVKNYYGRILKRTEDLRTSACTVASGAIHRNLLFRNALDKVPQQVKSRFYGCGNPVPLGIHGLKVLDLGCGSGRDCYMAAQFVGESGQVTGLDMTQEQLHVAQEYVEQFTRDMGYKSPNLKFLQGYIEFIEEAGVERESQDLVISNCVVNLSPNKEQVLRGVYNVLKFGGEFYFSDVYCDRRLPKEVRSNELLYGECISGALYINDFLALARRVGFTDPRRVSISEIQIHDDELRAILGEARFFSITYRLFKLDNLEPQCEDYGQVAVYLGTIEGQPHSYVLDDHHKFMTSKPALVCGNTASMLSETWLSRHFTVFGDRSTHYGEFSCATSPLDNSVTQLHQNNLGGVSNSCKLSSSSSSCC